MYTVTHNALAFSHVCIHTHGKVETGGSWDFAAESVSSRCSERPCLKSIRESN